MVEQNFKQTNQILNEISNEQLKKKSLIKLLNKIFELSDKILK